MTTYIASIWRTTPEGVRTLHAESPFKTIVVAQQWADGIWHHLQRTTCDDVEVHIGEVVLPSSDLTSLRNAILDEAIAAVRDGDGMRASATMTAACARIEALKTKEI